MKTAIKHTLMGLLALASLQSHAEDFISDGLRYEILSQTDCTVSVAKNDNVEGDIEIPSELVFDNKTYKVISIGDDAFHGCSNLTSVIIPYSVASIGRSAFSNCSGLTSVTIPNSITVIGISAFAYCSELTSVTIPNSVTAIGRFAFSDCSELTSVTVPNSVTSLGHGTFQNCAKLTSVTIPNSVTTLWGNTFSGCSSLTSVTIPNSVTKIGQYVFSGCSGLTSVVIPNSVTTIELYAFRDCSGLTSITIPNSAPSIHSSAFHGCTGLTSVTIPNSVTEIWAFDRCTSLKTIYMQCEEPIPAGFCPEVYNEATLYVPIGTSDAYKNSNYWKNFKNIQEMDFSGISGTITDNNGTMQISVNKGTLIINGIDNCGSITIYDMQGRIAYTGTSHTIEHLLPGLYIVKAGSQIAKVSI